MGLNFSSGILFYELRTPRCPPMNPNRKLLLWAIGIFLAEGSAAGFTALICLAHQRPFPLSIFVGSSLLLLTALAIFIVTVCDFWAEGKRLKDFACTHILATGILIALVVVTIIGTQVDFLVGQQMLRPAEVHNPRPAGHTSPGWWLLIQIGMSAIALIFCVHLKRLSWLPANSAGGEKTEGIAS